MGCSLPSIWVDITPLIPALQACRAVFCQIPCLVIIVGITVGLLPLGLGDIDPGQGPFLGLSRSLDFLGLEYLGILGSIPLTLVIPFHVLPPLDSKTLELPSFVLASVVD